MNFYIYYSYEEWGRGYIGSRGCECLPEEDVSYLGTFHDKTFNPTEKVIIACFASREEALEAEIKLHHFYRVDVNPYFANLSRQTSKKFTYNASGEVLVTDGKSERKIRPEEKIPEGFRHWRLKRRWHTNGVDDVMLAEGETPPEGFFRGRARMMGEKNSRFGDPTFIEMTKERNRREVENGTHYFFGEAVGEIRKKLKGTKMWVNRVGQVRMAKEKPEGEWQNGRVWKEGR